MAQAKKNNNNMDSLGSIEEQINALREEQFALQNDISAKQKQINELKEKRNEKVQEKNRHLLDVLAEHKDDVALWFEHKYNDCKNENTSLYLQNEIDCPVCALLHLIDHKNDIYLIDGKRIVLKVEFEDMD